MNILCTLDEYAYFPTLETSALTINYRNGHTQVLEPDTHGEPDFDAAIAAVARTYGISERELDLGADRTESCGRNAMHVYHHRYGLLAKISYIPTNQSVVL
ncbi:hypothetical protein DB346_23700 [Verrucomicrobia bacterium LW23]|nr:hypothetical protein DB346_23700 [Verrucomicrobia bacterium LW23]